MASVESLKLPEPSTWTGTIIIALAFPFVFAALFSFARYIWHHIAIKHDVSALAYLGNAGRLQKSTGRHAPTSTPYPPHYAHCPIYPDTPRYYEVRDTTLTDNNPIDVIGFVVGKPKWLEVPPAGEDPGYYAELIINWDKADKLREWTRRGYGIQMASLTDGNKTDLSRSDNRYLAISPFSEDGKRIVDAIIKFHEFRTFRCRPYKKHGFRTADDLGHRQLSWQVGVSRWIVRLATAVYH